MLPLVIGVSGETPTAADVPQHIFWKRERQGAAEHGFLTDTLHRSAVMLCLRRL